MGEVDEELIDLLEKGHPTAQKEGDQDGELYITGRTESWPKNVSLGTLFGAHYQHPMANC